MGVARAWFDGSAWQGGLSKKNPIILYIFKNLIMQEQSVAGGGKAASTKKYFFIAYSRVRNRRRAGN